jgi:hypothetical protein
LFYEIVWDVVDLFWHRLACWQAKLFHYMAAQVMQTERHGASGAVGYMAEVNSKQVDQHFVRSNQEMIVFPICRSDYMAALVTHHVQQDAELVIVEYAVNDRKTNEPWESNQERCVGGSGG